MRSGLEPLGPGAAQIKLEARYLGEWGMQQASDCRGHFRAIDMHTDQTTHELSHSHQIAGIRCLNRRDGAWTSWQQSRAVSTAD